jgi:hypothetical protein
VVFPLSSQWAVEEMSDPGDPSCSRGGTVEQGRGSSEARDSRARVSSWLNNAMPLATVRVILAMNVVHQKQT